MPQEHDQERLERALRAAHEAGDTEAARRLAAEIRRARDVQGLAEDIDTRRRSQSPAYDIPSAAASAVREGIANVAGLPGSAFNLVGDIRQRASQAGASLGARMFGADDATADAIAQAVHPDAPVLPIGMNATRDATEALTGDFNQGQTRAGRFANSAVEMATEGALGGGARGLVSRGAQGATAGLVSEAGGQVFEGTSLEVPARVLGALFGGAVVGVPTGNRSTPDQMVHRRTVDLTDAQWQQAIELERAAQRLGIPLMGPEALPSPTLRQLASDTADTAAGGPVIERFVGQRRGDDGQVARVVSDVTQGATGDPISDPAATTRQINAAGQEAISRGQRWRADEARPYYEAARDEVVPVDEVERVLALIDNANISGASPVRGVADDLAFELRGTDTNAAALEDLVQRWDDRLSSPPIGGAEAATERQARAILGPIIGNLRDTIAEHSPAIRMGRQASASVTENVVRPMEEGAIGSIARGETPNAVTRPVTDPASVRPATVRATMNELSRADPNAARALARLYLENQWNTAARDLRSGPSSTTGAVYRRAIMGTPQQRANMRAMMDSLDLADGLPPGTRWRSFDTAMEVLASTDTIPGAGSPTNRRGQTAIEAGENVISGTVDTANIMRGGPIDFLARYWRDMTQSRSYEELAEAFTRPGSVEYLRAMANADGFDPATSAVVAQFLISATQPQQ